MKIRFIKTALIEVHNIRLDEIWDKYFQRWDELVADTVTYLGERATICTSEGDILCDVPINAFEVVKEDRPKLSSSDRDNHMGKTSCRF